MSEDKIRVINGNETMELVRMGSVSPNVVSLPVAVNRVWTVLPAAYDALGIAIENIDGTNHIMGNIGLKIRRRLGKVLLSEYLSCGKNSTGSPLADTYEIQLSVLTQLKPDTAGTTSAATSVSATAKPVAVSGTSVRCASTGQLESRLMGAVRARLVM